MAQPFQVRASDTEELKGYYWPAEAARANLCVMTGMNEYAYRYNDFALWMNAHGVNVWVLDAFGQGLNAPSYNMQERWPLKAFQKNVQAICRMTRLARRNGLKTFLLGHSMGSFMVQSFMERFPLATDGIILCGSNGGQALLMKAGSLLAGSIVHDHNWYNENPTLQNMGMGSFARAVKNRKTDFDWLSYNEENVQAYINDPWCGHFNTGGFWKEFLGGLSKIWDKKEMAKISPKEKVLIIAGQDDPVGRMGKGPEWLYRKYTDLGLTDTRLRIYPRMRHEILNETGKEIVYQDILDFISRE